MRHCVIDIRPICVLVLLTVLLWMPGNPVFGQVAEDHLTQAKGNSPATLHDKLLSAQRIVFLGDSITNKGQFIVELEYRLLELRSWMRGQSVVNLGLSSETCCGLSEPAHPFPRPNVQTRIDDVLEKADPDVVVVCYGVNDGIYHPYSDQRFAKYKKGLGQLVGKIKAAGAIAIVLTPPPFDALPMRKSGKLVPASAVDFSWKQIYERYDEEVIQVYSDWIMENSLQADLVVDVGGPIRKFVAEKRKQDASFALSADGIHINKVGHQQMALAIVEKLDFPSFVGQDGNVSEGRSQMIELIRKRQSITHPAWVTYVGHSRPKVAAGIPIDQAKQLAEEIGAKIEQLASATQLEVTVK